MIHHGYTKPIRLLAGVPRSSIEADIDRFSLGCSAVDDALSGGLSRRGLHEFYSPGHSHVGAATGFALAVAVLAANAKPILWVSQDFLERETGRLEPTGLCDAGFDPSRLVLVRARDIEGVLRAAEQAARCTALGAVVIVPWGNPKMLDLTASRRLSLASAKSGVPSLMLRLGAFPSPSAAATRWMVKAMPSHPLAANSPGYSACEVTLLRQRGGAAGQAWCVEFDYDRGCFQEQKSRSTAPLSRPVVCAPADRPAAATGTIQDASRAG